MFLLTLENGRMDFNMQKNLFAKRSTEKELMDDLTLNNEALRQNLRELETYNQWLGGKKVLLRALNKIQKKYFSYCQSNTLRIADLGCGGGDLLTSMRGWANQHHLDVELIGIDANPCMLEYAAKKSAPSLNIQYQAFDIFSPQFAQMQFDIISINSVCHHFSDDELVRLFKQLAQQTRLAIIVNDLHRHWLSYYAIKTITRLFNFSYLAKNDAPLSVLRAFRKEEFINLLKLAHLSDFQLHSAWPFRFELIIWSDIH